MKTVFLWELRLMSREGVIIVAATALFICCVWAGVAGRLSMMRLQAARIELRSAEEARAAKEQAVASRLLPVSSRSTVPPYGPLHPQYVRNFASFSAVPAPPALGGLSLGNAGADGETLNPIRIRTGSFDIARIAVFLYPLLVLALCYGIFDIERNHATDPLILSMPVPPWTVLGGRILARVAMAVGMVLIVCICSLASGWGLLPAQELALRMLPVGGALLFYGAFWVMAASVGGSVARSGSTAIALLGVLWATSAWVIPSGLRWMAATIYPVAPRTEYINSLRTIPDSLQGNTADLRKAFLTRHPEYRALKRLTRYGEAQVNSAARGEELSDRMDQLEDHFSTQARRRDQWVDSFSWLTPSLLTDQVLSSAAGTDAAYRASVEAQKRAFQSTLDRFYWPRIFEERIFTPADYDRIPRFRDESETAASAVRRTIRPAFLLLLWNLGAMTFLCVLQAHRRTSY
jgi:ABC-type transport system involved in multi-copper enzyme maturation permease subunit